MFLVRVVQNGLDSSAVADLLMGLWSDDDATQWQQSQKLPDEVLIDPAEFGELKEQRLPLDFAGIHTFEVKIMNKQIPQSFIDLWTANKICPTTAKSAINIMRYLAPTEQEVEFRYFAYDKFPFPE